MRLAFWASGFSEQACGRWGQVEAASDGMSSPLCWVEHPICPKEWRSSSERDLHSEPAAHFAREISRAGLAQVALAGLTQGRKLDQGNPNPGNLGAGFSRLGLELWPALGPNCGSSTAGLPYGNGPWRPCALGATPSPLAPSSDALPCPAPFAAEQPTPVRVPGG